MPRILIVDDDRETCRFMADLLDRPEREIETAYDPHTALALVGREPFDLVISDINLNAEQSGLDILKAFRQSSPHGQVLLISGFGTLETAIDAVRAGAFDYISKPFDINEVKATVERALAQADAGGGASPAPAREVRPPGLIGRTAPMLAVYKQIAYAADAGVPVLIVGESGTGKELVAKAVHANGRRANRPFVAVNCGAIAEGLLESELFGHVRGAFTGAVSDTKGHLRAGERRNGVPRRDWGNVARAAGEAPARPRRGELKTASITRSTSEVDSRPVKVRMRSIIVSRSSLSFPFSINFPTDQRMFVTARSRIS